MTIGIYSLYWEEPDLIYIGQSSNIETRYKKHLSMLKCGTHPNYKVKDVFTKYGKPLLDILQVSNIEELDTLEAYYIEEFNSITSGLNISYVEPGNGRSYNNPNAKYSKWKILRVFSRLYNGVYSIAEISEVESVNRGLVSRIALGSHHSWLQEEYYTQFLQMRQLLEYRKSHNDKGGRPEKTVTLISPAGNIITFTNICKFCRENNLSQPAISGLLSGKRLTHKGYKLYKEREHV